MTDTFIQPKITGYRQLTTGEVALMNEGKALADSGAATSSPSCARPDSMRTNSPNTLGEACSISVGSASAPPICAVSWL